MCVCHSDVQSVGDVAGTQTKADNNIKQVGGMDAGTDMVSVVLHVDR